MSEGTTMQEQPAASGAVTRVLRGVLTGIGGLAYAFIVWTAVFYAVQLSAGGMTGYGWFLLLLPAIVAVLIFVVALVLGRRRSIGVLVLVVLAGLALSAVFLLNTFSYVIRNIETLTGG